MNFDRDILMYFHFSKVRSINIKCSNCHTGILVPVKTQDKIIKEKTAYLKSSEKEEYYNGYDYELRCCYVFLCNNRECEESYLVIGKEYEDGEYEYNPATGYEERIDITFFQPLYFYPTIHLFDLSKHIPKAISDEVIKSFSLFFNDLSSSANKLRLVLELVMNNLNIPMINNKGKSIDLHNRILLFGKIDSDMSEKLLATKIVGNSGSHVGHIEKSDIIDAFEIIEDALYELYVRKQKSIELKNKTQAIIAKNKAPKKPSTPVIPLPPGA